MTNNLIDKRNNSISVIFPILSLIMLKREVKDEKDISA